MTIRELFENSSETMEDFLLNCLSDRIENISEIPEMLSNTAYLENKDSLISQTTKCEILAADDYRITEYDVNREFINVIFNMDFIMQTFINSEYIWRIQCTASAEIIIKNNMTTDFHEFDPDDYKKYENLIKINNIKYHDAECDTLYT